MHRASSHTLKELEERLDSAEFFRAHKSAIVDLSHARGIVPSKGGRHELVMADATRSEVPLSRSQARAPRALVRW